MKYLLYKLAQIKAYIIAFVMRCEMIIIYIKCKKHIKGRNNDLWSGIKTIYPVSKKCGVTINEMVALLIHCVASPGDIYYSLYLAQKVN